ncbi:TetR/AcrR family transcriptional regulator [Melittangium boletus]|uniref:TetR family transcriptional regulator n=1 Tax=Melittangium boletus DSM 14713 TaxID=1294270 RepID=A0A250IDT1_9BACT|nr:TetR/AcrR family transcriptional regulator [Melittangium boletus]ATB29999.1 TetR family transcriptional regulator [Melittangium boletus DSM 14713]
MGRPRQVLDEEILETARACFIEHGASVSTETIAARLGVSGPALLKRFGSKRELLKAAFAVGSAPPWLPLVEAGPDARDFRTQVRELAHTIDGFFRRMVPAFSVLREAGITPEEWRGKDDPAPARAFEATTDWFRRAQERDLLRGGDPKVMAGLFMAGVQYRYFLAHVTNQRVLSEEEDPWLERLLDILWHGIGPSEKAP